MKRSITLAALSGLLIIATACGSDDAGVSAQESGTAAPDGASPTDVSDGGTSDGDTTDDTTGGTTDGTDAGSSPDVSTPDFSIPDFSVPDLSIPDFTVPPGLSEECQAVYTSVTDAATKVLAGDGAEAQAAADDLSAVLLDALPAELQDEGQVLSGVFDDMAQVMADFDGDMTKILQDPEAGAVFNRFDSPEVQTASDAISNYFEDQCPGIDL